jgi:predicted short-subunit dehydrogenase-like oxidoreductase (DUF2520 family)
LNKPLQIVIIGAGNLAQHIAASFHSKAQVEVVQIFNHRKTGAAATFAKQHQQQLTTNYKNITTQADVYFICVKDDAIGDVVKNLIPLHLKGLVVHTSGSTDADILKKVSPRTGVYYPLQAFTKNAPINWQTTPLLIEGNTKSAVTTLNSLAALVSDTVKQCSTEKRLQLHLAAVFASNFTNALYASAFDLVENSLSKKDTELLKPIMQQSFNKLQTLSPKQAQTGPAMRNDKVVMKKHLQLLKTNKELSAIYKLLSQLIIKQQSSL